MNRLSSDSPESLSEGNRLDGLSFNVSNLMRQSIGARARHHIDTREPLVLDDVVTERMSGDADLMRTNFGILARVRLCSHVELECDRCLEPFNATVDAKFEEEYLPVIDVVSGRPVESERTDGTFLISAQHTVDMTEAVRQYLLLALPMRKVCREDCLGLCSSCGSNKNLRDCGCTQEVAHPFSAISILLENSTGNQ